MTKKIINFLIIAMAILLIGFIILIAFDNKVQADDSDSKQIAEYEYQMNELRKAKEKCFDDLTRKETQEYLSGFTKPCIQFDEQIMELREKADQLKAKSYEVGLD